MTCRIFSAALFSGVILLLFVNGAEAVPGDYVGDGLSSLQRLSPVERIQYSGSDNAGDGRDCFDLYQINCPVPRYTNPMEALAGHYWRPGAPDHRYRDAPARGLSSGGAAASPGFQGGGVPAFHDYSGAGADFRGLGSAGVRASPGFVANVPDFHGFGGGQGSYAFGGERDVQGGGVPAFHDDYGAGAGFHGLGSAGVRASSPGFMADAPAFHGFGAGQGSRGFGGEGDFHGAAGGAFSFGGRGGIGHR